MLLICPSCDTAFRVETTALGPTGREVRCARCRATWFAGPVLMIGAPEAEIEAASAASCSTEGHPEVGFAGDIVLRDSPPLVPVDEEALAAALTEPINEEVLVEPASASAAKSIEPPRRPAWDKLVWRGRDRRPRARSGLALATLALGAIALAALASPAMLVRLVPNMASLYAAAGISVNLRGLEFRELRTRRESHDGIALLVTEGEIVNVSGRELELPRIRLAAVSPSGREIYAWTAAPARERLAEGEVLSFKSRLASPPTDARHVQVRFLARGDQAWSLQ